MSYCFCMNPGCVAAGRCLGAPSKGLENYRSVMDNFITEAASDLAGNLDAYIRGVLKASNRPIEEYHLQQWTEWADGKLVTCSRLVPTETSQKVTGSEAQSEQESSGSSAETP